jgi:transcription termination factor Rho
MAILDRKSLEQSPLADLHAIASELSIDGYRRLRKPQLIDAILEREEGADADGAADVERDEDEAPSRPRRRGRRRKREDSEPHAEGLEEIEKELEPEPPREEEAETAPEAPRDELVEGVVELLPNGSGFVRVEPPEPSDGDVYISSAQVRRCELVTGDRVAGPRRAPRRSERFAALVRIDTINGRPASELADAARYDDLAASFPSQPFEFGDDADPSVKAVASATPIGRGSRVTIAGPAQSGKSELLKRLAAALAGRDELQLWVVLAGVRPEELGEWRDGPTTPAASLGFASSQDAQAQAVEATVEQARRLAARGTHAVVLIDTLAGLPAHLARRALAAARKLENGSLTVIATAYAPLGGETTVIALDRSLAREGTFPALDSAASWTMRSELLAGGDG